MLKNVLEGLFDVVFTIIGGFIAGFIGFLIERWRRNMQVRDRHFSDIKEKCLIPLFKKLLDLKHYFEFSESNVSTIYKINEMLNLDIKWWEYYSFKEFDVDPFLYDDLTNHYNELAKMLNEVQSFMNTGYSKFLSYVRDLSQKIENDVEFRDFKRKFEGAVVTEISLYPYYAVFLYSLGVDKGKWPNVYEFFKKSQYFDELIKIGEKFYGTEEAKKVREIQAQILTKIDVCYKKVKEIVLSAKLNGKCKYL